MYVRLVHPQPQPGQAEEYARRWQAISIRGGRPFSGRTSPCVRAGRARWRTLRLVFRGG